MLIKYKLFNHCQYQYAQCQVYLKNDKNTISVHLNHVQQQPMTFIVVRIFHSPLKEFLSSKNPHPLSPFPQAISARTERGTIPRADQGSRNQAFTIEKLSGSAMWCPVATRAGRVQKGPLCRLSSRLNSRMRPRRCGQLSVYGLQKNPVAHVAISSALLASRGGSNEAAHDAPHSQDLLILFHSLHQ